MPLHMMLPYDTIGWFSRFNVRVHVRVRVRVSQVVSSLAREVVRESTNDLIKEYLASERLQANNGKGLAGSVSGGAAVDPLVVFVQEEVVDVVVEEEANEVSAA